MMFLIATAWAGGTAQIGVLAGVRGNAESTLEQPHATTIEGLEPSATGAVLIDGRWRWESGLWVAGAGEVWTYAPEADPTLLRAAPALGGALDLGPLIHLDVGTRYSLESVPLRVDRSNGRSEATGQLGIDHGPHRLRLLAEGTARTWFDRPDWSFRTAEAGLAWTVQPSDLRFGARATGQRNAAATGVGVRGIDAVRGQQLRLGASAGWSGSAWDVGAEYRHDRANDGAIEETARPQFTPFGDYDADADALSAGGYLQHRLALTCSGRLAEGWTLDVDLLGRARHHAPPGSAPAFLRTVHGGLDLGRTLTGPYRLHLVAAASTLELPTGGTATDPSAWLHLRWESTPQKTGR